MNQNNIVIRLLTRNGTLRKIDLVLIPTAIVLVALSWSSFIVRERTREELQAVRNEFRNPLLLNGYKLNLLQRLDLIDQLAVLNPRDEPAPVLLVVLSDECPYCQNELPNWIQLIERLSDKGSTYEAWLLSYGNTTALAETLMQRIAVLGGSYRLLAAKDLSRFTRASGLAATPITIALDASYHLREVTISLTPENLNEFIEQFPS